MSDLERDLELELHRVLDPVSRMTIPAWRRPAPAGLGRQLLGGAGAAFAAKLLTGVAVLAAATTVAGAATTGSFNPVDWSQGVSETVESCKAALSSGQHGIGDCVSAAAKHHGQHGQSGQAVASAARQHGKSNGNGNGNGAGNGAGNGHGNNSNDHGGNGKNPAPPTNQGEVIQGGGISHSGSPPTAPPTH